uniref:Uncharacterized protein n=1 Tax=Tanacetum cinerariifolium TaxID=118510 RepID=A0A699ITA6_TANCI|nr:hypothetical protein [Tanacetum cinerariifolium]
MNSYETEHAIARDEGWVPSAKRVKISPTNARLETSVKQKEETFQIVINLIMHSTCFKAFTISADVPEIFMKILDICLRKEGEDFTEVQNDEDTLTFLVDLGYTGSLHKENVDHPTLIWEDIAYQIDHKKENKSRREIMPYPRFTKVIINYFLSKHKSLKKPKFRHYHTIKDDDIVSRLKYVRIREDYQEYGLSIPETMMNVDIIESESYQRFLLYSSGLIPPKKSRGKEPLFRKKTSRRKVVKKKATISTADNIIPDLDLALKLDKSISLNEAEEEAAARQVHATHARIMSQKLKGVQKLTPKEQEVADIMKALKESKKTSRRHPGTGGSDKGTGMVPGVPDESIVVFDSSSEGTGTKPGVLDEEKVILEWGSDEESERSDKDSDAEKEDEKTESDSKDIYKYKIKVRKDVDEEIKDADNAECENKEKEVIYNETK